MQVKNYLAGLKYTYLGYIIKKQKKILFVKSKVNIS